MSPPAIGAVSSRRSPFIQSELRSGWMGRQCCRSWLGLKPAWWCSCTAWAAVAPTAIEKSLVSLAVKTEEYGVLNCCSSASAYPRAASGANEESRSRPKICLAQRWTKGLGCGEGVRSSSQESTLAFHLLPVDGQHEAWSSEPSPVCAHTCLQMLWSENEREREMLTKLRQVSSLGGGQV